MCDGYTIYNGPPDQVQKFYSARGLKMSRFANPADKLLMIATQPNFLLEESTTVLDLAADVRSKQKENLELTVTEADRINDDLESRITVIAESRYVSFCRQMQILIHAMFVHVKRNPISVSFLVVVAAMNSFLWASIYWKIGDDKFKIIGSDNRELVINLLGMSFLIIQDGFIETSFGQVLQIPQAYPVFKREVSGKMYSPLAYYLAKQFVSIMSFLIYPLLLTLFGYWSFALGGGY